ncbi:MAG: hypothetical protein AMXMBFR13_31170 [Phycisphaerae bacterium]
MGHDQPCGDRIAKETYRREQLEPDEKHGHGGPTLQADPFQISRMPGAQTSVRVKASRAHHRDTETQRRP